MPFLTDINNGDIMRICYSNIGIVLIHGFGGDTKDVLPLTNKLSMLGYQVETPLLTGHTGKKDDMKKANYKDWISDVENAYVRLKEKCDEIILIGFSMGGLLSLQVASKFKVKGIITLNTPIYIGSIINALKLIINDIIHFKFHNIKKMYRTVMRLPIKAYWNFKCLLKETKRILPSINCDILVNQAINDEVVKSKSAYFLHEQIPSKNKKVMFYNNSNHLILHSEIAEEVMIDLVKYIECFKS